MIERMRRLELERLRLEKIEAKKRKLHEAMLKPTKKETANLAA
jgi:hypothetical protein